GEGAALFLERAAAADSGFAATAEDLVAVGEICRRLDGVPLAIELAAPRTRLLSPPQLLERLGPRLTLSGPRDAPERQRTLDGAIAWSYDLLAHDERRAFAQLGVFRGSFTIEAAEAVLAEADVVDILGSLLDKSMVYRVTGD